MTTFTTRLLAPAILLTALAVAACGPATASGEVPSSSASAAPSEMPGASASAEPSAGASAAASPSAEASPSASASAGGDLAGTIPTTVGDVTLTASEVDAEAYIGANVSRQLTPLLTAIGKTPADVTVATASGSAAGGATLFIDAVRVNGADAAAMLTAFQAAAAAVPGSQVDIADIGGKSAVRVTTTSYTLGVYAVGDTVYYVQSPDAALVEQGIAALP